jgi:hypothetical protein
VQGAGFLVLGFSFWKKTGFPDSYEPWILPLFFVAKVLLENKKVPKQELGNQYFSTKFAANLRPKT